MQAGHIRCQFEGGGPPASLSWDVRHQHCIYEEHYPIKSALPYSYWRLDAPAREPQPGFLVAPIPLVGEPTSPSTRLKREPAF